MTKDELKQLDIMDQIEYINLQLTKGGTLTSICKEIGIGRSTLTDRFRKINYLFSKSNNRYEYNDSNTTVRSVEKATIQKCNISVEEIETKANDSNTDVGLINDKSIQGNLINIAKEYNTLIEMIELYKKNSNILINQIVIDLDTTDNTLTTLRVNTEVLRQFNEFIEEHKEYKKMDLVSMALKEYVLNHS